DDADVVIDQLCGDPSEAAQARLGYHHLTSCTGIPVVLSIATAERLFVRQQTGQRGIFSTRRGSTSVAQRLASMTWSGRGEADHPPKKRPSSKAARSPRREAIAG